MTRRSSPFRAFLLLGVAISIGGVILCELLLRRHLASLIFVAGAIVAYALLGSWDRLHDHAMNQGPDISPPRREASQES